MHGYNYAYLDELTKKEIRRGLLKAVAIPGHQVPFGSREMPIARGWGTGGLQITLSLIGSGDVVKIIDQGTDAGVNALNIKRLITRTTGLETTEDTAEATVIQTRHRIPEERLHKHQILVLQVPLPEPLRLVEPSEAKTRQLHADQDYTKAWVYLYEDIVRNGQLTHAAGYPVLVDERYVMATSPVPRWDVPRFHQADCLFLFGAGREKRIYAVPPRTDVRPLDFADYPFDVERFPQGCAICGSTTTFLDEHPAADGVARTYTCSDTAACEKRVAGGVLDPWPSFSNSRSRE
ncbi:MAG: carbon-phosphorus lyase complex subunit PhnJ [Chloroflexi bacterium]|nr:carbon-phosphorus lyase complex subunit PhnJ [Chloroflexota bacterium]